MCDGRAVNQINSNWAINLCLRLHFVSGIYVKFIFAFDVCKYGFHTNMLENVRSKNAYNI